MNIASVVELVRGRLLTRGKALVPDAGVAGGRKVARRDEIGGIPVIDDHTVAVVVGPAAFPATVADFTFDAAATTIIDIAANTPMEAALERQGRNNGKKHQPSHDRHPSVARRPDVMCACSLAQVMGKVKGEGQGARKTVTMRSAAIEGGEEFVEGGH